MELCRERGGLACSWDNDRLLVVGALGRCDGGADRCLSLTVGLGDSRWPSFLFGCHTAGGAGTVVEVFWAFAVGTVAAVLCDCGWVGSRASVRLPLRTGVVAYTARDFLEARVGWPGVPVVVHGLFVAWSVGLFVRLWGWTSIVA